MRLNGDLGSVARFAGYGRISTSPSAISGTSSSNNVRINSGSRRERILRPLRSRAHFGDDRLDSAALLVALAVDLLGTRQKRLDLAEVDKHVVAVASLLDDAPTTSPCRSLYSSYISRSASRMR